MTRKTTQSKSELFSKASGDSRTERMSLSEKREKIYEKFYNNIRILCSAETISMVDLSRNLGIKSGRRLHDFAYGRCKPDAEELIVLASHFKCTIDDLLNKTAVIGWE